MAGLKIELSPVPGMTPSGSLGATLTLQCPPLDQFERQYAFSFTDYETMSNQHSAKGVPQLATFQFDTLTIDYAEIPANRTTPEPSFALNTDYPEDVTATLIALNQSGDPFLFTAAYDLPAQGFSGWGSSLAGPELQMYATLRNVSVTEKAGEPDARYYSLSFTEYRPALVPVAGRLRPKRPGSKPQIAGFTIDSHGKVYTTRTVAVRGKGGKVTFTQVKDKQVLPSPVTLAAIAKQVYANPSYAAVIATANNLNIGNNQPLTDLPQFASVKANKPLTLKLPDAATAAKASANPRKAAAIIAAVPTVVSRTRQD